MSGANNLHPGEYCANSNRRHAQMSDVCADLPFALERVAGVRMGLHGCTGRYYHWLLRGNAMIALYCVVGFLYLTLGGIGAFALEMQLRELGESMTIFDLMMYMVFWPVVWWLELMYRLGRKLHFWAKHKL
jgi:hypothetical protein